MQASPPTAEELDTARAARLLWRAARLRCPNCGEGGLFHTPLRMRSDCPTCGLSLDRGESDYFLGAYLVNLVAVELLFAVLLVTVLIATWPNTPWALLQWGGAALMVAGAIICYPFAKSFWLAFDVMLRPVEPQELPSPLPPELQPPAGGARP